MPSANAARVDQILFGWSEHTLTGHRGLGPMLSSLGSEEEIAWWERRLVAHQWAAVEVGDQPGPAGLVYFRVGDQAAIVHKDTITDAHGRGGAPLAHALVGPAALLDARTALGLNDWPGWIRPQTGSPELRTLAGREVQQAAQAGYARLSSRARLVDALMLKQFVAEVLADPGGRFCIYPPPGAVTPAAELMCCLIDIVGGTDSHAWTFATAESHEPGTEESPRMVFLTGAPGFSLQGVIGRRVRLGRTAPPISPGDRDDGDGDQPAPLRLFAGALVEAYTDGGQDILDDLRPSGPLDTADAVLAWSEAAQFAPGVLASARYLLHGVETGQMEPEAVAALWPDVGGRLGGRFTRGLAEMSAEAFARHLPAWRKGSAAAGRYTDVAGVIRTEAVWRLLNGDQSLTERAVAALGITGELCGEQLMRCHAEHGQHALAVAFARALALTLTRSAEEITAPLTRLPPAELLALAQEAAPAQPTVAFLLLQIALDRPITGEDRGACAAALTQRGYLTDVARHCRPDDPPTQSSLLAALLTAVFQEDLDVPEVTEGVIGHAIRTHNYLLLHALGTSARDPGVRSYVLREAGQLAFEEQGLGPLKSPGSASRGSLPDRMPEVMKSVARFFGGKGRTP